MGAVALLAVVQASYALAREKHSFSILGYPIWVASNSAGSIDHCPSSSRVAEMRPALMARRIVLLAQRSPAKQCRG